MALHLEISASLAIYLCDVEQSFPKKNMTPLQVLKNYPPQPNTFHANPTPLIIMNTPFN